jgi:DNA-binding beta-propeller fold protein YncE
VGSYKCECIRGYDVHDVGSSRKSCKAVGPHGSIIFGSTNTIKQLSLAGPHESVLTEINNMRHGYICDVAFDYNKNTVYWINLARIKSASPVTPTNINDVAAVPDQIMAEAYLSLSSSQRTHIIGNQCGSPYFLSVIRLPAYWPNARKLAYDWIKKQLYLVDSNAGTVQVVSTDGDQRYYVKSKLPQPKDISVNPFNNELYVSVGGTHPGIVRMKTDGSEFKMFVSDNIGQPTGITLDLPGKRLYWLDAKYRLIESIRLDGKGRAVVKYLTTGSSFHTISVFEDLVYWTQKSSSNIFVANRFTGETVRTISAGLSISPGFELVHEVLQISELCKYPENRFYNVTSPEKQWSKVGHFVNLTCKPGHQLEGSSVIKCQSDGTWFPTPGTCIPQHVETGNSSVAEGFCKYPENNMYNVENFKKELYKPGDQLVIKCIPGYQLKGTSVIECQSDGTWYPTPGKCIPQHEETAFCKYPERNSSYNENNPKKEQYEAGDQLVIKCKPGYQLKGSSVIDCRSDGIWHPRPGTCNPQHVDPRNSSIVDGTQERNIGIGIGTMLLIVVITITAIIVAIAAILVWKRRSLKSADPKVSYNVTKSPEDDTINLPGALETEDGESSTI